ncbi:MAG TPA: type II toxin-antitoxin system PemK/MazF family toxin [Nitrospirae bacterium]|nr:type II toxin-antitoxin system PemK/MazF family toxin [Nitrospirota bacterium]
MGVVVNRFDIYIVSLDPTRGSEIKKTRPCVVISPDEMNHNINTVIIAPMTSSSKKYPTRVPVEFQGKKGQIVLDQIRTIDKTRLTKKIGRVKQITSEKVLTVLQEMFEL